jgi:hypothetical protein
MAITVVCPGCHGRFSVSDKFGGKQGPCPKCKTVISIPKAADEVKIHSPEDYGGAKTTTGKLVLKPIAREQTKLSTAWVAAIGAATIITLGLAIMLRFAFPPEAAPSEAANPAVVEPPDPSRNQFAPPTPVEPTVAGTKTRSTVPTPLLALGALALALPLSLGAYSFLRSDDELEPYRGRELFVRASICAVVYALLWGFYWLMGEFGLVQQMPMLWVFVGPVFVVIGGTAAFFALDLEFGAAVLHYAFYLAVTVILRMVMGLPPV